MNKPESKTVKVLDLIKCIAYTAQKHFPDDVKREPQFRVQTRLWQVLTREEFIAGNGTYVSIPFADWVDDNDLIWSEIPKDIEDFMRKLVEDFELPLSYTDPTVIWEITW